MQYQLYLDTRQGEESNNYNTYFCIQDQKLNAVRGIRVQVCSAMFPNAVYPINRFNNKLYFVEHVSNVTSNILTVTLTYGNYTGSQIATALSSLMTSASVNTITYTWAYDSEDKILSLTSTLAGADYFQFAIDSNFIYEELGFDLDSFEDPYQEYVGSYPVNLSGTSYVHVCTNLSTMNYSSGYVNDILCRIPVSVTFGNIVYWENQQSTPPFFVSAPSMQEFRLTLRDDKGNFYELPDNAHFAIELNVSVIPDS
jgi:hypothetical protein